MKILFETGSTCVGGAERVLLRIAQGLRRLRPDWQLDAVVLCDRGGLEAEYQATLHHVWDGPPLYKDSGWRIHDLVKQHDYDIVHCIDSFHLTAAAARVCPGVPFIQAVYPNVEKSPFAPPSAWMNDPDLPYAALVTEFKANAARLPKLPHGEVLTIPNGIDVKFWKPGDCQRDIDVLWCARTDPEKGIGTAIELASMLCKHGLRFIIITSERDGPVQKLEYLERQYPTFMYSSKNPPESLREYFRRTKIFLSTSTVEGMPATPLEAAACGCRPFVPPIDGLAECFWGESNEYGFCWPETDRLGYWIERLWYESGNWTPIGSTIARWIAKRYSVENMVNGYLGLYERLGR